jgi:hypothetical protein
MLYSVMLITLVAMPMLILSSEIVRVMYVGVHIQTTVDSACTAAVQAVDVPYFIQMVWCVLTVQPPQVMQSVSLTVQ